MQIPAKILPIFFCLIFSGGCASYYASPDFTVRATGIHTVAIVSPAGIKILNHGQEAVALSEASREVVVSALESMMTEKGYQVKILNFEKPALSGDLALQAKFSVIEKRYQNAILPVTLQGKPIPGFSLGSSLDEIVKKVETDAFIFPLILIRDSQDSPQILISVIDALDGHIIWHQDSKPEKSSWRVSDLKALRRAVQKAFLDYPALSYGKDPFEEADRNYLEEKQRADLAAAALPFNARQNQ